MAKGSGRGRGGRGRGGRGRGGRGGGRRNSDAAASASAASGRPVREAAAAAAASINELAAKESNLAPDVFDENDDTMQWRPAGSETKPAGQNKRGRGKKKYSRKIEAALDAAAIGRTSVLSGDPVASSVSAEVIPSWGDRDWVGQQAKNYDKAPEKIRKAVSNAEAHKFLLANPAVLEMVEAGCDTDTLVEAIIAQQAGLAIAECVQGRSGTNTATYPVNSLCGMLGGGVLGKTTEGYVEYREIVLVRLFLSSTKIEELRPLLRPDGREIIRQTRARLDARCSARKNGTLTGSGKAGNAKPEYVLGYSLNADGGKGAFLRDGQYGTKQAKRGGDRSANASIAGGGFGGRPADFVEGWKDIPGRPNVQFKVYRDMFFLERHKLGKPSEIPSWNNAKMKELLEAQLKKIKAQRAAADGYNHSLNRKQQTLEKEIKALL